VTWFRSSRRRRSEAQPAAEPEREVREGVPSASPQAVAEERPVAAVASPEELAGRPLADLHALAREHGVPRFRLLRKEQLLEALGGAPTPSATTPSATALAEPEPQLEREAEPQPEPEPEPVPEPREVRISEVTAASVDVLDTLQRLVSELSSSAPKPHAAELEEIIESPVTRLIVARDGGDEVVGMLTLALFRIPTGMRAWIEDVVVDQAARGEGVGEKLVREAIRIASENGARTIDLTSNRRREAANRMYGKLGFGRRDTTVYRIDSP
jgi:ribosomal protein S18 acetylase RimI-like enzyme